MFNKWIPIFKTGTHTASNGNTQNWTEDKLDKMVNTLDTKYHEPPATIGHPEHDKPAYGYVEELKRTGNLLYAKFKNIVPEFADMVNNGMFKKRSISVYPDGRLRHVGFLGAMPPAVKGLSDVMFNDEEKITIEFTEENLNNERQVKKMKFKEFLEKMKELMNGVDPESEITDKSFSEAEIKSKVDIAIATALETEKTKLTSDFSEKESALKKREDAIKAKEAEAKKSEVKNFCENLTKEGKLIPAMDKLGMGFSNFCEVITESQTTFDFAEGEGNKQTPVEFFREFCEKYLPKQIEFGEVAGQNKDIPKGIDKREKVIKNFQETNKVDYKTAVLEVSKSNPEMFKD